MRPRRQMLLALLVGFVLPVGSYYVLRTLGVSPVIALLAGGAPALVRTVYTIIRERRIDQIALFTLSLLAAGALASVITGSPRWLLARGGVYTGIIGGLTTGPDGIRAVRTAAGAPSAPGTP